MTGFDGYESLAAFREDLKMDACHRNDIWRVAVMGDRKWMEWVTALAGWLTSGEMRWFDRSEAEEAPQWALGR